MTRDQAFLFLLQINYFKFVLSLGFYDSRASAAAGYDLCARVLTTLGVPRRLNFPLDTSLDAAASKAISVLPLPSAEIRAILGPGTTAPLSARIALLKQILRSIDIPGRSIRKIKESRFRGVSRQASGWRARLQVGGKRVMLGTFRTEEEAAKAYDAAASGLVSIRTMRLNFPLEDSRDAAI